MCLYFLSFLSIAMVWAITYIYIYMAIQIHNGDVIMGTTAGQITSLTIVYLIVYSDADQRKHQSSASLAFVWEFTGDRWIPRTNGQ